MDRLNDTAKSSALIFGLADIPADVVSMRQQLMDMQHKQKVDALMAAYEKNVEPVEVGTKLDEPVTVGQQENPKNRSGAFDDLQKENLEIKNISDYNNCVKNIGLQFFANKSIKKQSDGQLEKSIASWSANVELHQDKLAHPEKYDSGWISKSDKHKAGLLWHWEKEIRNFEKNIKEAKEELAERGYTD